MLLKIVNIFCRGDLKWLMLLSKVDKWESAWNHSLIHCNAVTISAIVCS